MPWTMLMNKSVWFGAVLAVLGAALSIQTSRLKASARAEAAALQTSAQWRANFHAMEATNAANVAALEKLQAEALRIERIASAARASTARQAAEIESLRRKLRHVPPNDDGPVRPVLCNTVNELRRLSGEPGLACGG